MDLKSTIFDVKKSKTKKNEKRFSLEKNLFKQKIVFKLRQVKFRKN